MAAAVAYPPPPPLGGSAGDNDDGGGDGGAEPELDPADLEKKLGLHPPADEDSTSVLAIIFNDHDRIKGLYRRYKDPNDAPHERQLLAWQLLRELTVHCHAEEEVVYPLVAEIKEEEGQEGGEGGAGGGGVDGTALRERALDEHASLALFTSDLEAMRADQEGFEEKMAQLMEAFFMHIHSEEHTLLPALHRRFWEDEQQLRLIGRRFEEAKMRAPTSPHKVGERPHHHRQHHQHQHQRADEEEELVPSVVEEGKAAEAEGGAGPEALLDAARDAARFEGTPPPLGSPSTQVLRGRKAEEAEAEAQKEEGA